MAKKSQSRTRSRSDKGQDRGRTRGIEGDAVDNERVGSLSRRVERVHAASRGVAGDGATLKDMSRDSARLQPIRLAGANCLSLDAWLNGSSTDGLALGDTQATRDADLIPCLNVREVTKAAHLTRLESRALLHTQRGVPAYRLAKALRCRKCEAKHALQTAQLKVRNLQRGGVERDRLIDYIPVPDSVRLTFRERTVRGQPYALIRLDEIFAEIMAKEKFIGLISQRDPSSYEKRRASLGARTRRLIVFTTEVSEQEIAVEKLRLYYLRGSRSPEFIDDLARGLVQRSNREQAEASERDRIHGLGDSELDEADKTCLARIAVLRESIPADEKKLERLIKQLRERQTNTGTVAREEIEKRLETNRESLRTENWRIGVIREEQAHRERQTLEPQVFADLNSKEAKAARRSDIEHMQRTRALIARHANDAAVVGPLAGLDHALGNAIAMLAWIDKIDQSGKLRAAGI